MKDLKNELDIMDSAGHHPNLVNLIGACSSEGESALKLELNILEFFDATFLRRINRSAIGKGKDMYYTR